jgi:hypothetical protein
MKSIIKFLFVLSVFVYLVMTLYVYAFLPDNLLIISVFGSLDISNDAFFYWSNGLFVLLMGLSMLFTNMISGIQPNEQTYFNAGLKKAVVAWSSALRLVISIFFTLSISFIGMSQNDEHLDITNFAFLVYIGPVLFFIWILSLFFLLLKNK